MVFSPSLRRLIISSARILTNPSSEGVREHSERGGGLATSVRAGLSYPRSEAEWDLTVRANLRSRRSYYPQSEAEWDLTVRANLAYQPLVEGFVG